ncbi:hypothetical protein [Mongoliibacter ruber]|nr:hypothetical protein [Mongoliibacter ruber]
MSEDTHGGEVRQFPNSSVPKFIISSIIIGKGDALSEGCAFGFMILELIAQKGY